MFKIRMMLSVLPLLWMLAPAPAAAEEAARNYFGAALVSGEFAPEGGPSFDVAGGHVQLGREVAPFFAIEARVGAGLENVDEVGNVDVTTQVEYWGSVFGRAYLPLDRVRPYALLGYTAGKASARAATSSGGIDASDSDQDTSWGLGLELYGDDKTALMIEWVRYMDTDIYRIDAWALGITTHF